MLQYEKNVLMKRADLIKKIESIGFTEIEEYSCWKHDNHKYLFFFHPERPIVAINWILYSYCEIDKYLLEHGLVKKEIKYMGFEEALSHYRQGKSLRRKSDTEGIWSWSQSQPSYRLNNEHLNATDWYVVE